MTSSFSEAGYLIPRAPHPRSCFFEQTVLKRQVGHNLLQGQCLGSKFLNLGCRCLTGGVTRQPVLPSFEEFLRLGITKALNNTLAAAQRGDALFAPKTGQDDPDLLLGRVMLAGLPLDAADQFVSGILRCSGFLVHLRSIMASMNQKASVTQTPKSLRWALTSDSDAGTDWQMAISSQTHAPRMAFRIVSDIPILVGSPAQLCRKLSSTF